MKRNRRITVPMLREHLEQLRAQYTAIIENDRGGIVWKEQHRGGLQVIENLILDIDNDIPSMLMHKQAKP